MIQLIPACLSDGSRSADDAGCFHRYVGGFPALGVSPGHGSTCSGNNGVCTSSPIPVQRGPTDITFIDHLDVFGRMSQDPLAKSHVLLAPK